MVQTWVTPAKVKEDDNLMLSYEKNYYKFFSSVIQEVTYNCPRKE